MTIIYLIAVLIILALMYVSDWMDDRRKHEQIMKKLDVEIEWAKSSQIRK